MAGKGSKMVRSNSQKGRRGRVAGAPAKKPVKSFKSYIYRVLKKIDGKADMAIGKKTMSILNSFLHDLFDRVAREASHITDASRKRTLGAREVQAAVKLIFPGELALNAVAEGTAASQRYESSRA